MSSLSTICESLQYNMGPVINAALEDEDVLEILVNPDTSLWIERFGQPMVKVGTFEPSKTRMIISLVASSLDTLATVEHPVIEGELPTDGSRFEGILPPNVSNPTMTIRKKASKVFTLADYVASGVMPEQVKLLIEEAIAAHGNILVIGGTSSGKTTLVNGIIHGISTITPDDRLIIIEDTAELQSSSQNTVFLRTSEFVSMNALLRATMRLRPDRILVGEVRGGEALTLLKAWNTGHPGGVATVHANSAEEGMERLEELVAEATPMPKNKLIGRALDLNVFITKTPEGRRVTEVVKVNGFNPLQQQYNTEVLYEAA